MKIWNLIKEKEYVSFDIFDTLIKRNVSAPTDIHKVVAGIYNLEYGKIIEDFPKRRRRAEKAAREKGAGEEVTLQEIYNEIEYSGEIASILYNLEIRAELMLCQVNYLMMGLYRKCIDEGKRVVLTSDMYLPEEIICEILKNGKISGYEKLYLSSSIGLQKGSGNLYRFILTDLGIDGRKIVHIGDGLITDFVRPFQAGIIGIHIKRKLNNLKYVDDERIFGNNNFLWSFVNNNITAYSDQSYLYRSGYESFGPLILGYLLWIHEKINKCGIQRAYFLARDMHLFIELYHDLFPEDDVRYLEVSRKSLRKAYVLAKQNVESILDTIGRKKYTMHDICMALDVDYKQVKKHLSSIGLNSESLFNDLIENESILTSVNKAMLEAIQRDRDYTTEYLKQMGVYDDLVTALVDIGWHGTIQNMMETVTKRKFEGLYLGNTRRKNYERMNTMGYWFNTDNELESIHNISMVGILETMLFPDVGTTVGYRKDGNTVISVHRQSEALSYKIIKEFQDGAVRFLKDIQKLIKSGNSGTDILSLWDMSAENCMRAYIKMAYRPVLRDARCFGNLDYEDNRIVKLAHPQSIASYLVHPEKFINDYRECKWKTGFIKQIMPFVSKPDVLDSVIKRINNR